MRRQMTLEDLNQVAQAVAMLDPEHVISVTIWPKGNATVLLTTKALSESAALVGVSGEALEREQATHPNSYWRLSFRLGDMELVAMARPDELPLFGLSAEDVQAAQEPASALQAS